MSDYKIFSTFAHYFSNSQGNNAMGSTLSSGSEALTVKFTKMHGIGNDYVYVYDAASDASSSGSLPGDLNQLARNISDRHCGVGGDGLVVISRYRDNAEADFSMRIFNADGSEAQMCGNASRCIGKYLYEKGLTRSATIRLQTLAGVKVLHLETEGDTVKRVRVDMGTPTFIPELIPACECRPVPSSFMLNEVKVNFKGEKLWFSTLSMGNPHAVCFLPTSPTDHHVLELGPYVETYPAWPERVNVEFARVVNEHLIEMRVWERGSGETMACGTGACATAVAAISRGLVKSPVTIRLIGGDLEIDWEPSSGHVFMTGGATMVADGIYYLSSEKDNFNLHPRQ